MSLSVVGRIVPLLKVICVSPPVVTVITSEPEKVILVLVSPSPVIESSCMSPTLVISASLKLVAPNEFAAAVEVRPAAIVTPPPSAI